MYEIELNNVGAAIVDLKLGKSDGEEGLSSDFNPSLPSDFLNLRWTIAVFTLFNLIS